MFAIYFILNKLLKSILLFSMLWLTPQYLTAQDYQHDTARINNLLISAKSKRFTDTTTALKECFQALDLAKKHNDGFWTYKAYHRLARIHDVNSQTLKAHAFFLAELSVENKVEDGIKGMIYSEVAASYMALGDPRTAYQYHLKHLELAQNTQDLKVKQGAYLEVGYFYRDMNDFEKASHYIVKSLDFALQINDPDEICDSYRTLAVIYAKSKNHDLALKNSEKSLEFIDKINDATFPRYFVYISNAQIKKECGKLNEALVITEKALILCEEVGDKSTIATTLMLLADIHFKMNDFQKAQYYYNKCTPLVAVMEEHDVIAYEYNIANSKLITGQYNQVIDHIKKSLAFSEKLAKKLAIQKNYALLAAAYEKLGNKDEAIFYFKKSDALKDSIFAEENTKRVAEAQFKFDLVQSEEQLKSMKYRQMNIIAIGFFVILTLVVGFLAYFSSSKNEKNKILSDKNLEIRDKNRQLEESNEMLRQFAYASAHDLKEPLRSINSFVNIIQKKYMKSLPEEANEYMGFVTNGVKRMEGLLNALLEFSSILAFEDNNPKKNDVAIILKNAFHQYQHLIEKKNANIRYAASFPSITMGERHLQKLLFNIINNALKFSKQPANIEIGYEITPKELIIFIKDEGVGMDETYKDKVFKLFQRLDKATHLEDIGIGLTICKNIVDKFSGRIWFESVLGQGTIFYIAFPKSMVSDLPTTPPQYLVLSEGEMVA
jgi:signal transduction histidine kinase